MTPADELLDPRVAGRFMALSFVSAAIDGYFPARQAGRLHQGQRDAPMRQVSLGPLPPRAGTEQTLDWLIRAVREFENASTEDPIAVAGSYGANSTYPTTRQLNVTSPTAANIAAVLASFFSDLLKRGIHVSS